MLFNLYFLPIVGLAGMIVSYYSIRKTRDKKYSASLAVFITVFIIDLFTGTKDTPADSIVILKQTLLAFGWLVWAIAHFKRPK